MIRITITLLFTMFSLVSLMAQNNWQIEQEKIIRERIERFVEAINTADEDVFSDTFSDKLYSVETKKRLKASVIERANFYTINYYIHLKEIKVDDKMAYEEGWFRSELIPKNGSEHVIQEFDFLDVWELENDGKWRIVKAMKKERPLNEYKSVSVLNGEYAKIAGSYATDKFPVDIKVTTSDQLVLVVNNGSPITLKKNGELSYSLDGVSGAELKFELGSTGVATKAIMKQANGDVIANRQ